MQPIHWSLSSLPILPSFVDKEDLWSRRLIVAAFGVVGGLIVGVLLSVTFRWYPYFWQWLAYHNGLVVAVLIYLMLPSREWQPSEEAMDEIDLAPPPRIVWGSRIVVRRLGETWVADRTALLHRANTRGQVEKSELRASRRTAWSSNGKGFERTAAVPNQNRRGRRFAKQSRQ
jgi:hypothetical protein